jgi:hypothetical protein
LTKDGILVVLNRKGREECKDPLKIVSQQNEGNHTDMRQCERQKPKLIENVPSTNYTDANNTVKGFLDRMNYLITSRL